MSQYVCILASSAGTLLLPVISHSCCSSGGCCSSQDTASDSHAGDPSGSFLGNNFPTSSICIRCCIWEGNVTVTGLGGQSTGTERHRRWRRRMRSGDPCRHPL